MQAESVARRVGCSLPEYESLLAELDQLAIPSRTPDGIIFSRRMVRDEKERAGNRERQARFRKNGGGKPDRWNAIRIKILERDNYVCAYCGKAATSVDHITPQSKGGTEDNSNLVGCCKSCNQIKNDRTLEKAGMSFWRGFDQSVLRICNTSVTPNEDESEIEAKAEGFPANRSIEEQCAQLYAMYPRHVGRGAAVKAIRAALKKADFETLRAAVVAYAAAEKGNDPKFIPHPSSWFNAERWADEVDAKPIPKSRVLSPEELAGWSPHGDDE
jgi:5-methylcytosine-specific restriction endonuclease McrA